MHARTTGGKGRGKGRGREEEEEEAEGSAQGSGGVVLCFEVMDTSRKTTEQAPRQDIPACARVIGVRSVGERGSARPPGSALDFPATRRCCEGGKEEKEEREEARENVCPPPLLLPSGVPREGGAHERP